LIFDVDKNNSFSMVNPADKAFFQKGVVDGVRPLKVYPYDLESPT